MPEVSWTLAPVPAVGVARRVAPERVGHRPNVRVPRRIEEEREGEPVVRPDVAHPVRRRPVSTAGHALEHVAEVDDERVRDGRCRDPALGAADFEAAGGVLDEDREQPVVGVLADAPPNGPVRRLRRKRRIPEDAEQDRGLRGEVTFEPVVVEVERARDATQQCVADRGQRVDELEYRGAQAVGSVGKEVRAVQRPSRPHARIVRTELLAEVQAFLPVGHPRRQLAAEREPAAPRAPAARHGDPRLLVLRAREELTRQRVDACRQLGGHIVSGDVEEAGRAARPVDLGRHRVGPVVVAQRPDVDDRQPQGPRARHGP